MTGMFTLAQGGSTPQPKYQNFNAKNYLNTNIQAKQWYDKQRAAGDTRSDTELLYSHYNDYGSEMGLGGWDAPMDGGGNALTSTGNIASGTGNFAGPNPAAPAGSAGTPPPGGYSAPQSAGTPTTQPAPGGGTPTADPTGLYALIKQMKDEAAKPYDYSGAPAAPVATEEDRRKTEERIRGYQEGHLNERYAQERQAFDQRMANSGVDIGTPRYKQEFELWDKTRNSAYQESAYGAFRESGAEQDRLFGLGEKSRANYIGEQDSLRSRKFDELGNIIDPLIRDKGITTQKDIAVMQDKTANKGIDVGASTERYKTDEGTKLGEKEIGSSERIAQWRNSNDIVVAKLNSATSKEIAELQATVQRDGYASQEQISAARDSLERELQTSRITADQAAQQRAQLDELEQLQKTQDWTGGENKKERKARIKELRISIKGQLAAVRAGKSGGGGGGGGEDLASIMALMEQLQQLEDAEAAE